MEGGAFLPNHVEGDHVMSARVKEHVDAPLSHHQVTGNENAIGNFAGEFTEILQFRRNRDPPVEVGSEMPAGKPSVAAPLGPQFLPRLIVIEAERGIQLERPWRVRPSSARRE